MYDENELFTAALGLHIHYQVKKMEFNLDEGELHIHFQVPPSLYPMGESQGLQATRGFVLLPALTLKTGILA